MSQRLTSQSRPPCLLALTFFLPSSLQYSVSLKNGLVQGWSFVFLITIVPVVNWNTKIILICFSVMSMDVVNFEKYLWVICVSSLENSQFISLAHLLTGRIFWYLFFQFFVYS